MKMLYTATVTLCLLSAGARAASPQTCEKFTADVGAEYRKTHGKEPAERDFGMWKKLCSSLSDDKANGYAPCLRKAGDDKARKACDKALFAR